MNKAVRQHQPRPLGRLRTLLALTLPALVGLLVMAFVVPFNQRRGRNLAIRTVSFLALRISRVQLTIHDPDNLLSRRPAIFTINHESALDPLLVAALLQRDVVPVVKSELRHQFPVGWLLACAGAVFVARDGTGKKALGGAATALSHGQAIALAPQGTRQAHVRAGSFRPGVVHLARDTGTSLVMIFLRNAGARMPARQWRLFPGTVQVEVLGEIRANDATLEGLERHYLQAEAEAQAP